ncbi:YheU family protein [Pseudoalteromonas sp. T1lg23B]|uniref:YheU family protein n=1 Tax=Pseudoalteromonas sp. T1lg23B TaxID=2077097 RepID=UPI000CF636C1|nr:YheU family protein [Pseudoalteromonas sp. T1lg23B]
MIVPYQQLDATTLDNLIEHYVLREGTDYGEQEFSTEAKVEHVRAQLKSGEALIVYSQLHESVNIVSKAQFQAMQDEDYSDYQ